VVCFEGNDELMGLMRLFEGCGLFIRSFSSVEFSEVSVFVMLNVRSVSYWC